MVSLDRFDGSCNNAVDDLSVFITRKTKSVYDKVFNMTARINEAKTFVNANSIVQHRIHIKNETMKHANANVKTIKRAKNIIVRTLLHIFVRMIR